MPYLFFTGEEAMRSLPLISGQLKQYAMILFQFILQHCRTHFHLEEYKMSSLLKLPTSIIKTIKSLEIWKIVVMSWSLPICYWNSPTSTQRDTRPDKNCHCTLPNCLLIADNLTNNERLKEIKEWFTPIFYVEYVHDLLFINMQVLSSSSFP